MNKEIQLLLSNLKQIQVSNESKQITCHQLQWKYGTITFTSEQPNQLMVTSLTKTGDKHNLFLTTQPFSKSQQIPSLLLQSKQELKTLNSVEKIVGFMMKSSATRNSHLIVKGGGLLMDLGAFSASIYMRGIKHLTLIPTTLLGMVDATVGGKTATNYANTKNLIGTIRNANHIIVYPQFTYTQTQRQFFNGMVETIKMAITYDKQFFQFLQKVDFKSLRNPQNLPVLQNIIKRSLMIKIAVVEKDLTEQHQRKWLNFGHTIAHGIQLDQSNTLLHGQCVAIGMVKAFEISVNKNILKQSQILIRLQKLLWKMNLPLDIPKSINIDEMIRRMLKDKKKSSSNKSEIDFVLIEQIGKRCQQPTKITVEDLKRYFSTSIQVKYPHSSSIKPINDTFQFPSSKSISLRYLFISSLSLYYHYINLNQSANSQSKTKIKLSNFLSSEDTQKMIISLKQLGFKFNINQDKRQIQCIGYKPKDQGQLDIGNSGITARFILPLCFMIKGKWIIKCQKRMEERPNKQIFKLCSQHFEGKIKYLNKQFSFPVQIQSEGKVIQNTPLIVQGKDSSQFISSAMINWSFIQNQTQILLPSQGSSSQLVSQSYLHMTTKCLQTFGIRSRIDKINKKIAINSSNIKIPQNITIENDLSTYSYPYIFYELHELQNYLLRKENYMQGDVLFYDYVEQMKRIISQGDHKEVVKFNFNNCTDTFMTFMVFCCSDKVIESGIKRIVIENIANQRVKESNRIDLTIKNLKKIGVCVEQYENKVEIVTKPLNSLSFVNNETIIFQTDEDHRLAMSFGILSSFLSKKFPQTRFMIDSKKAVEKTFPQFWQYLEQSGINLNFISAQKLRQSQFNLSPKEHKNLYQKFNLNEKVVKNSLLIVGNRGSGKTTIGKNVAKDLGFVFLDLDDLITDEINHQFKLQSIEKMVQKYGWSQFRDLESKVLQNALSTLRYSSSTPFVISTGGGILERPLNQAALKREKSNVIYLQRPFNELKAFTTVSRPSLQSFQQISKQRQLLYENHSSLIVTLPQWLERQKQQKIFSQSVLQYLGKEKQMQEGYILCLGDELLDYENLLTDEEINEVETVQIRVDKLLAKGLSFKQIRQAIARFNQKNDSKKTILTLRTKTQLGQFEQSSNSAYAYTMKIVSRIPCQFLDFQVSKQPIFPYNFNKFIWSYHGNNQDILKKLIEKEYGFKKFCYMRQKNQNQITSALNLYQKYQNYFRKGICINLSNSLSRFQTKYQMIIPQSSSNLPSSTGIMTLHQMKSLKKILKLP